MSKEYNIICPYCFQRFSHTEAIFRANTGFFPEELEDGYSGFTMSGSSRGQENSEEQETKRLFRRFDDENSFSNDKKLDQELISFWKERGGASGYVNADPQWDFPHIDPKRPDEFSRMIVYEPRAHLVPDEDGFIRDKDGFVTRVIDRYSNPNTQMARLCPGCHNPLPLPDYGKFPVIFISVVGITGSGKTVYLNQLLTRFARVMQNTGYRIGPAALAVNEVVMENQPLPGSTDDQVMRRPLAVSLTKNDNSAEGMTIVFYDIAGENCVASLDANGKVRDNTTIGHFIAHCDGLMFLIDPEQIPIFAPVAVSQSKNIQNVIDVVTRIRAALNPDHPYWNDIPVAAVLTKSDLLRGKLDTDSPIFRPVSGTDVQGAVIDGFNREEFAGIHRQLSTRFQDNADVITASMDAFATKAYFAVSAITCGVENRFEKYQNKYTLTPENNRKFNSLIRWTRAWNKRTPEERLHFQQCPVRDRNGQPITFPAESDITAETAAGITTEIFAESVQDDYVNTIYLDLWEIASEELDLVGYPTAPPNPRRIEEPLKWILWQKRFLAPYFSPEPMPKKSPLCSKRKYEQILSDWEARNIDREARFYGGEEL